MKIRLQIFQTENQRPVRSLPIIVELRTETPNQGNVTISNRSTIGRLATDRNGYVSFYAGCEYLNEKYNSVWAYVEGRYDKGVDLRTFLRANGPDAVFEWRLGRDEVENVRREPALAAVREPDHLDFQYSPLSLDSTSLTFGNFDCEKLVPQHVQTQDFTLNQVAREAGAAFDITPIDPDKPTLSGRNANLLKYNVAYEWLGYSMGKLIDSLTLAPCETVTIAVKEWQLSAESSAQRSESFSDAVSSRLSRERMIRDSVIGAVLEAGIGVGQSRGARFDGNGAASGLLSGAGAAGAAGAAGGLLGGGIASLAGRLAGSIVGGIGAFVGKSLSASFNARALAARTTQRLNEQIGFQASREMSSNVFAIQRVTQNETDVIRTRKVHNPNHCHTQTINYYDITDNYNVRTECVSTRDAMMIQYPVEAFDKDKIFCNRHLFRGFLLDPALEEGLASMGKVATCCGEDDENNCVRVNSLRIKLTIGTNGTSSDIKFVMWI
ncbi:MAG: hypothetical protein AAF570_13230, partial [Bacteroidota bacterium]